MLVLFDRVGAEKLTGVKPDLPWFVEVEILHEKTKWGTTWVWFRHGEEVYESVCDTLYEEAGGFSIKGLC